MKLAGGFYLWALIIVIFFRWAVAHEREQRHFTLVRVEDGLPPAAAPVAEDTPAPPAPSVP
jgi:hypothetical protein